MPNWNYENSASGGLVKQLLTLTLLVTSGMHASATTAAAATNESQISPFLFAIERAGTDRNGLEDIETALKNGANPNQPYHQTEHHDTAFTGFLKVFRQQANNRTPYKAAVLQKPDSEKLPWMARYTGIVNLFLEKGAHTNSHNNSPAPLALVRELSQRREGNIVNPVFSVETICNITLDGSDRRLCNT
jgi:hypothetical protein